MIAMLLFVIRFVRRDALHIYNNLFYRECFGNASLFQAASSVARALSLLEWAIFADGFCMFGWFWLTAKLAAIPQ